MSDTSMPHTPRVGGGRELTASQVVLVVAVTLALATGALALWNTFSEDGPLWRGFAVGCARVAAVSAVVAVVCGLLQLRRQTAGPDESRTAPDASTIRIRIVILGCLIGVFAVGAVFAWLGSVENGVVFIGLGSILIPAAIGWQAWHFKWRW